MKKYAILVLVLVLTAALFSGCGCTNQDPSRNTVPTTMPTTAATETTQATTMPTAPSTEPSTQPTIDNGNGPLEGMEGATENTAARQGTPGVR